MALCTGSGVLGDLGVHLVDLAQMLAGEMTEVVATRSVTVEKRILTSGDGYGTVETDDNCSFIAKFSSGA